MKQIKLSFNQSKQLMWNDKEIRVKQNGMVLYLERYDDEVVAKDMSGEEVKVDVQVDECFA